MNKRAQLEDECRKIGAAISEGIREGGTDDTYFMLMFFRGESVAYISNAKRRDVARALREQAARLEGGN